MAKAVKKTTFAGVGALVQLGGLLVIWIFPIGTIAGVILLLWGSQLSVYYRCSECATKLGDKKARICPGCRTALTA